jgi:hypothetical protein
MEIAAFNDKLTGVAALDAAGAQLGGVNGGILTLQVASGWGFV